jgi:hypothetical protein|tara:strand:- start:87 stop:206 length:120 start_codon:yes stop_codon:yes gene_type:complete
MIITTAIIHNDSEYEWRENIKILKAWRGRTILKTSKKKG